MKKTTRIQQKSMASMMPVKSLETAQRLVTHVEAVVMPCCAGASSRLSPAVRLSGWRACGWGPRSLRLRSRLPNESGISVSQPAQPSVSTTEAGHLVLSMVDRSELESRALPELHGSTRQSTLDRQAQRGPSAVRLARLGSTPPWQPSLPRRRRRCSMQSRAMAQDTRTPVPRPAATRPSFISWEPSTSWDQQPAGSFSVSSAKSGVSGAR